MSDKSAIEWTDASWNPLRAGSGGKWYCEKLSPGCDHCYSSTFNRRLGGIAYPAVGDRGSYQLHHLNPIHIDEKTLTQPFHWRRPRKVFVCSMTDLFGEWVTDEQLDRVFAIMALTPHHTYQILTKRPTRMRDYLGHFEWDGYSYEWGDGDIRKRINQATQKIPLWPDEAEDGYPTHGEWPLPNVWAGTTIEHQRFAWRANVLRQTQAAVRWISAEPLLSSLSLNLEHVDWLVAGGESGGPKERRLVEPCCRKGSPFPPGRLPGGAIRPCDFYDNHECDLHDWRLKTEAMGWLRSIRDQCASAGTSFFYKQAGGPTPKSGGRLLDGVTHDAFPDTKGA
jgi:protein gp37